jgi:Flp pilus assembly pilin Flp
MSISVLKTVWREEDGQDLVEYSLLLAFIALAAVVVLQNTSTSLNKLWNTISATLSNAASSAS